MDAPAFTQAIARMTGPELRAVAAAIARRHGSAADEVAWWQATLGIDRTLRAARLARSAAAAASGAAQAVRSSAAAAGIGDRDGDITLVARSAAEVARGLVAGPAAARAVTQLLESWRPVLGTPTAA